MQLAMARALQNAMWCISANIDPSHQHVLLFVILHWIVFARPSPPYYYSCVLHCYFLVVILPAWPS